MLKVQAALQRAMSGYGCPVESWAPAIHTEQVNVTTTANAPSSGNLYPLAVNDGDRRKAMAQASPHKSVSQQRLPSSPDLRPSGNQPPQSKIYGTPLWHSEQAMVMYGRLVVHSERLPVKRRRVMGIVIEPKLGRGPLCRSPEKRAEVWASDRFQGPLGRRAGPARRSRGSRRCTFPRCPRACAKKC